MFGFFPVDSGFVEGLFGMDHEAAGEASQGIMRGAGGVDGTARNDRQVKSPEEEAAAQR